MKVQIHHFGPEEGMDTVKLYEGVGPNKLLIGDLFVQRERECVCVLSILLSEQALNRCLSI